MLSTDVVIEWIVKIGVVFFVLMTAIAYVTFLERRLLGFYSNAAWPIVLAIWTAATSGDVLSFLQRRYHPSRC